MPLFNNFPLTNFHEMNLDALLKEMKKIEPLQNTVNELAGKYYDMYNKVDSLARLYESFAAEIEADLEQFKNDVTAAITSAMNTLDVNITARFNAQDAQLSAFDTRITNVENTVVNAAYIDSPFTGERVPVQEVIYQLASLHTTDALTAAEYDAADLTAAAYDALQLTAYAYDWNGATYIN